VAFTMSMEPYKLTVMFFRLTNLLANFQAMMNDILRKLDNTGEMAFLIDNVLVGTGTEEKHIEVVEEILKRMEKNNLYIKLEKCI